MSRFSADLANPARRLERGMQTSAGMSLRNHPDAFIRSMVTAATVRPFWTTLMQMKQARLRVTRLAATPIAETIEVESTPRAA